MENNGIAKMRERIKGNEIRSKKNEEGITDLYDKRDLLEKADSRQDERLTKSEEKMKGIADAVKETKNIARETKDWVIRGIIGAAAAMLIIKYILP